MSVLVGGDLLQHTSQVSIRPSFLPEPSLLTLSDSGSNGQAVGYRVLWGINQLTGCHGGG